MSVQVSAQLVKIDLPKNTCRLGASSMTREEAAELLSRGLAAPLSITDARGMTGFYWLSLLIDRGEHTGYKLVEDCEGGMVYYLSLSLDSCECVGFLHWQTCKHRRTLLALKDRGLLP